MKKALLILASLVIILCIAAFITNPGEKEMKDELKKVLIEKYNKELEEEQADNPFLEWGRNFGEGFITKLVNNNSERLNYFLFSELELTIEGKKKTAALGVFGIVHVYELSDFPKE